MLETILCSIVLGAILLVLLPHLVFNLKEMASIFWRDWTEAWREVFGSRKRQ